MTEEPYVLDKYGTRIHAGDYVECRTDRYASVECGERRRVLRVGEDRLILPNKRSPVGISQYDAVNFRMCAGYAPWHNGGVDKRHPRNKYPPQEYGTITGRLTPTENNIMLHLALRLDVLGSPSDIARIVNDGYGTALTISIELATRAVMADTSPHGIKAKVKSRIEANPNERWLILSGTTLAEIANPPVKFTSVV